jgi:hypothetical protein
MKPYIKLFEDKQSQFIKDNLGKRLAIKQKGRFGVYSWIISTEKGDYQNIRLPTRPQGKRISADTEEDALKLYYMRYIK